MFLLNFFNKNKNHKINTGPSADEKKKCTHAHSTVGHKIYEQSS